MALALLALGLAGGRDAPGAAIATASTRPADRAVAHRCRCKSCTGDSSCCCAHGERTASPPSRPAPDPSPRPARSDAGPCLASAPCGEGEGLPASPAGVPSGKIASLVSPLVLRPPTGRSPYALEAPPRLPEAAPSRIDDPPESSSRP